MTTKFLVPLVLVPVTWFTSTPVLPIMERPGSMMSVKPSPATVLLIVSIRSLGEGILSPLHAFDYSLTADTIGVVPKTAETMPLGKMRAAPFEVK